MFPYSGPQLCSMEFLFRVAIIHAKMETTGSSLRSSLVHSLHIITQHLNSKSVTNKPSNWKLSNMKSSFACAITSVSSQIWHILSWTHPRQVGVLLCILLYRTVWRTASVSRSVGPDSLQPHELQPTRIHCPWDFFQQGYWSALPFPSPGDLRNQGIEHGSLALQADSLLTELRGKLMEYNSAVFLFQACDVWKEA